MPVLGLEIVLNRFSLKELIANHLKYRTIKTNKQENNNVSISNPPITNYTSSSNGTNKNNLHNVNREVLPGYPEPEPELVQWDPTDFSDLNRLRGGDKYSGTPPGPLNYDDRFFDADNDFDKDELGMPVHENRVAQISQLRLEQIAHDSNRILTDISIGVKNFNGLKALLVDFVNLQREILAGHSNREAMGIFMENVQKDNKALYEMFQKEQSHTSSATTSTAVTFSSFLHNELNVINTQMEMNQRTLGSLVNVLPVTTAIHQALENSQVEARKMHIEHMNMLEEIKNSRQSRQMDEVQAAITSRNESNGGPSADHRLDNQIVEAVNNRETLPYNGTLNDKLIKSLEAVMERNTLNADLFMQHFAQYNNENFGNKSQLALEFGQVSAIQNASLGERLKENYEKLFGEMSNDRAQLKNAFDEHTALIVKEAGSKDKQIHLMERLVGEFAALRNSLNQQKFQSESAHNMILANSQETNEQRKQHMALVDRINKQQEQLDQRETLALELVRAQTELQSEIRQRDGTIQSIMEKMELTDSNRLQEIATQKAQLLELQSQHAYKLSDISRGAKSQALELEKKVSALESHIQSLEEHQQKAIMPSADQDLYKSSLAAITSKNEMYEVQLFGILERYKEQASQYAEQFMNAIQTNAMEQADQSRRDLMVAYSQWTQLAGNQQLAIENNEETTRKMIEWTNSNFQNVIEAQNYALQQAPPAITNINTTNNYFNNIRNQISTPLLNISHFIAQDQIDRTNPTFPEAQDIEPDADMPTTNSNYVTLPNRLALKATGEEVLNDKETYALVKPTTALSDSTLLEMGGAMDTNPNIDDDLRSTLKLQRQKMLATDWQGFAAASMVNPSHISSLLQKAEHNKMQILNSGTLPNPATITNALQLLWGIGHSISDSDKVGRAMLQNLVSFWNKLATDNSEVDMNKFGRPAFGSMLVNPNSETAYLPTLITELRQLHELAYNPKSHQERLSNLHQWQNQVQKQHQIVIKEFDSADVYPDRAPPQTIVTRDSIGASTPQGAIMDQQSTLTSVEDLQIAIPNKQNEVSELSYQVPNIDLKFREIVPSKRVAMIKRKARLENTLNSGPYRFTEQFLQDADYLEPKSINLKATADKINQMAQEHYSDVDRVHQDTMETQADQSVPEDVLGYGISKHMDLHHMGHGINHKDLHKDIMNKFDHWHNDHHRKIIGHVRKYVQLLKHANHKPDTVGMGIVGMRPFIKSAPSVAQIKSVEFPKCEHCGDIHNLHLYHREKRTHSPSPAFKRMKIDTGEPLNRANNVIRLDEDIPNPNSVIGTGIMCGSCINGKGITKHGDMIEEFKTEPINEESKHPMAQKYHKQKQTALVTKEIRNLKFENNADRFTKDSLPVGKDFIKNAEVHYIASGKWSHHKFNELVHLLGHISHGVDHLPEMPPILSANIDALFIKYLQHLKLHKPSKTVLNFDKFHSYKSLYNYLEESPSIFWRIYTQK